MVSFLFCCMRIWRYFSFVGNYSGIPLDLSNLGWSTLVHVKNFDKSSRQRCIVAFVVLIFGALAGCQTAVVNSTSSTPIKPTTTTAPPTAVPTPQPVTLHQDDSIRLLWTQQPTLGAFLEEAGVTVLLTDQVFADNIQVPLGALNEWPLPQHVQIGQLFTITIQDDGQQMVKQTAAKTVGEALQEASVTLLAADHVEPALDSPIAADTIIRIRRSIPLTIQADGRIIQTRSSYTSPLDVLAEAGIALNDGDYTQPSSDTTLQPGSVIQVVRVTEDFRIEDQPIPYQTLWQASPDLDLDTQAVISAGQAGVLRRQYRIIYENGTAVGEELDSEWVEVEPVNEVIGYGTRITTHVVQTEQGPREYWRVVQMRVTSYTAASSGKPPDDPHYGITASGLPAGRGVVAIDRNIVPWRSEVFVPGYGVAIAGDTGGGVRGRWIDLGFPDDAYESWSGYVDVYYLTPIPAPEDINYLLPSILP